MPAMTPVVLTTLSLLALVAAWALLRLRKKRAQVLDLISAIMGEPLGLRHWRTCAMLAREDLSAWIGMLNMLELGKRLPEATLAALRTHTEAVGRDQSARASLCSLIEALPDVAWVDPLENVLGHHAPVGRKILDETISELRNGER